MIKVLSFVLKVVQLGVDALEVGGLEHVDVVDVRLDLLREHLVGLLELGDVVLDISDFGLQFDQLLRMPLDHFVGVLDLLCVPVHIVLHVGNLVLKPLQLVVLTIKEVVEVGLGFILGFLQVIKAVNAILVVLNLLLDILQPVLGALIKVIHSNLNGIAESLGLPF